MGSFAYKQRDGALERNRVSSATRRPPSRRTTAAQSRSGQALGADTAHMDATEVAFFCDPQLMVRGILVNGRGQRYIPEDTYPGRVGQATLFQQDNQAFLVIDEAAYEEGMNAESSSAQLRAQAELGGGDRRGTRRRDGIARRIAAIQPSTSTTRHAAEGSDPVLGKKSEWVKPIVGPFAAIDLRGRTGGFTLGGLKTTVDSEGSARLGCADPPDSSQRVAGTSGVCAGGYASGTSLGDGSFFGRRAGISAAR